MTRSPEIVKVAMSFSHAWRHNSKFNSQTDLDICCCCELARACVHTHCSWSSLNSEGKQGRVATVIAWRLQERSSQFFKLVKDVSIMLDWSPPFCKPNGGVLFDFKPHDSRMSCEGNQSSVRSLFPITMYAKAIRINTSRYMDCCHQITRKFNRKRVGCLKHLYCVSFLPTLPINQSKRLYSC